MTESEMSCMGQIRCVSRPITFWSPFIKKTVLQKKRGNFHSRQFGDRLFFTVAKPKFTVANGDHSVANVEPCYYSVTCFVSPKETDPVSGAIFFEHSSK